MQGKSKGYIRNLEQPIRRVIEKGQSALFLGPRQTGKTTLVKKCLSGMKNLMEYPLQNPAIRIEMEQDPSAIIRQVEARPEKPLIFMDEAQKVPEVLDSIQRRRLHLSAHREVEWAKR